jgi:ABC-2 type transport system permease protein
MRFFFSLFATSLRASLSLKLAFFIELVLNIGNNLIFFLMWWIFFDKFNSVGGWNFDDVLVMMAIVRGGYGLARICFGGSKVLAEKIITGGLDPYMTQPKNLLLHLLGSESQSKGWGHILSAVILFFLADVHLVQLPMILIGVLCGGLLFTSVATIAHSLCFWFGNVGEVSKKYTDSIFLFVHYPVNIYSGLMQVFMFTILPAGLIGYLPVELVKRFSWSMLFALVGATGVFVALAFLVFYRGLRRYESGNLFLT